VGLLLNNLIRDVPNVRVNARFVHSWFLFIVRETRKLPKEVFSITYTSRWPRYESFYLLHPNKLCLTFVNLDLGRNTNVLI